MRNLIIASFLLFSLASQAQYKTFTRSSTGDTLNAVDMKGMKQGKWTIHAAALRGEPAYEEEGVFINDKKEGTWYKYNTMGDLLAMENYRWGNKNGICRYFTPSGPEHDESWRAVNPSKSYDTIDVADLKNPNKFEKVIVKNEGVSMRHGTWKYYNPPTGRLLATENYFLDKLQQPGDDPAAASQVKFVDSTKIKSDTAKAAVKAKPKEVMEFEKKTSGKKKAVRDGRTG